MDFEYQVNDIYAELGKHVMKVVTFDKALDQMNAQIALLRKRGDEQQARITELEAQLTPNEGGESIGE